MVRVIAVCWLAALVVLVGSCGGAQQASSPADAPGFLPLFNGKDLAGWHVARPEAWHARDGMLVCTGEGEGLGYVHTDAQYEDFILRLEYRISKGGNSGIFIRGHASDPVHTGMEVQVLDDAGSEPGLHSANGIYGAIRPYRNVSKPAGQWNTVEIIALGRSVKVVTNGVKVVDVNLDEHAKLKDRSRRGYIFLQNHGNLVEYRNLRIRPLSRELFNGKDLSGWEVVGGQVWRVEDGVIVCEGGGGGWLRSEKQYEDLILKLDFNISPGGNSGVFFRSAPEGDPAFSGMEMQILDDPNTEAIHNVGSIYGALAPCVDAARPAGEWNQVEISCIGDDLTVRLNGIKIIDANLMDPALNALSIQGGPLSQRVRRGHVGMQNHGHHVEFRNLRITVPAE